MPSTPENILPYEHRTDERKDVQIERMFNRIAARYDRLNRILSLGIDRRWRRTCIRFFRPYQPNRMLDIASGTGDLAIEACRQLASVQVVAADLSDEMMAVGRQKVARAGLEGRIRFDHQNCMALTYANDTFDAVTVAFGVRNYADIGQGLGEMLRVLKPGGRVAILELSAPTRFPMKQLYRLYSHLMVTTIGGMLGLEKAAYRYLPQSIQAMPQGEQMVRMLHAQGFAHGRATQLTGGVCTLYTAVKPNGITSPQTPNDE